VARHLVLEDGTVYSGQPLGADLEISGEVVFNTGMTGYQEILTDPSYAGQIVTLTYPLIGNYGVNEDDFESFRVQAAGLVVGEASDVASNWRARYTLDEFLKARGVPGIQGLDTRALTLRLRSYGVAMGIITDRDPTAALEALHSAPKYGERLFVEEVSTPAPYAWGIEGREPVDAPSREYRCKLVVLDMGVKLNILRRFAAEGCRLIVLPYATPAAEILGWKPDGVVLSPGPGDPRHLKQVATTVRDLLGRIPMFGICLGNQMIAHAVGGETFKLKFGHRGSNHPVQDLKTGKVTITSQNHGYAVDPDSLVGTGAEVTQRNLNDGTVEGIEVKEKMAYSIQYHPEAAPGPWDSRPWFHDFLVRVGRAGA
jgi:carbamoyl-phosphate synthase small subunit